MWEFLIDLLIDTYLFSNTKILIELPLLLSPNYFVYKVKRHCHYLNERYVTEKINVGTVR